MARKKKSRAAKYAEKWEEYFEDTGLEAWQRLCADLGLRRDIPSKTQCRKVSGGPPVTMESNPTN